MFSLLKRVKAAVSKKPSRPPMTTHELELAIKHFIDVGYGLRDRYQQAWRSIKPVNVTTQFCGWGYVRGRDKGVIVNSHLTLVEADDDMEFTEYCVLIDGVPAILVMRRHPGVKISIVAERSLFDQVMGSHWLPLNDVKDYERLLGPVQRVMHDVLRCVADLEIQRRDSALDPIEKILDYKL